MQYRIRGTKVTSPYPVKLTPAEARLVFMLQKFFAPERIFADYFLPKNDEARDKSKARVVLEADLLQIDCLAVDRRGIFVFESKDYTGWIYGHGDRVHWTQVSAYGRNKHQFYNPVRQNQVHIEALQTICGGRTPVYSVIVFGRDATLKVLEDIPDGCMVCTQAELYSILNSLPNKYVLAEDEIDRLCNCLRDGGVWPNTRVREDHAAEVGAIAEMRQKQYE